MSAAHKLIDYLKRETFGGIRERIEMDAAIMGGDTLTQIAIDLGISVRTVYRRRKVLLGRGFAVTIPEEPDFIAGGWAKRRSA